MKERRERGRERERRWNMGGRPDSSDRLEKGLPAGGQARTERVEDAGAQGPADRPAVRPPLCRGAEAVRAPGLAGWQPCR